MTIFRSFLLLFTIFCWGCNHHPNNVPELFPCNVIVKNDSTPIQGALVTLGLEEGSSTWALSGVTNSSGLAIIKTTQQSWQGSGVPLGKYIVTISKLPDTSSLPTRSLSPTESASERERYQKELEERYKALPREVPEQFSDFGTSPFRISVESGKNNTFDIDISKIPPIKK
ncbi:MAG: hypothetical protein LBU34_02105 [Planctomycetaceae bacterium]|nr:hypothetical protein [Planctomycetaceae bacterium]